MSAAAPSQPVAAPTLLMSRRGLVQAGLAALSVIATSTAGRIVSAPGVAGWYRTIQKPWFNPPNWVFPVAWSALFMLMGIAFWRVLRTPAATPGRKIAIVLFVGQLAVNVTWSACFFRAHSPVLGLVVIVPFWLLIVATSLVFRRIDRSAAWLLVPYIAWVAFATLLNATIVELNG